MELIYNYKHHSLNRRGKKLAGDETRKILALKQVQLKKKVLSIKTKKMQYVIYWKKNERSKTNY